MTERELDLHGRTWAEAQQEFVHFYNHSLDQATDPNSIQLRVIHGYGSNGEGGVIRKRLRAFLDRHSDRLEFTPGESMDGNQGCTVVQPMKRLPDEDESLAEAIWDYCERPRTQSKVVWKFHKHGQPKIMQAIKSLEKQGRLATQNSVGPVKYVTR